MERLYDTAMGGPILFAVVMFGWMIYRAFRSGGEGR